MLDDPADADGITRLLREWQDGHPGAFDRLVPLVYQELKTIASRQLSRERRNDHLQTTVLVNEAYVRLFGQREVDWQNRGHFFAVAAQVIRRLLVDHARHRRRQKRGGGADAIALDDAIVEAPPAVDAVDAIALDRALRKLEQVDPQAAKIVELRFFAGLTIEETAAALDISTATVKREWAIAKGWLHRELSGGGSPDT